MTTHGLRRGLLAALLLIPSLASASVKETVTIEATGQGDSRDQAIATALATAVIQLQGKEIPADALSEMFLKSIRDERMVRMSTLSDIRVRATRISSAVAFVQDYQVQESKRSDDGKHWQARVVAEVVDPKARLARQQEKLLVSVLPFQYMQEEEGEVGGPEAQAETKKTLDAIAKFRHLLIQELAQMGRIEFHGIPDEKEQDYEAAAETPAKVDWPQLTGLTRASSFVTIQVEDFRVEPVKLKGNITTGRLDAIFNFHYRYIRTTDNQPVIISSGSYNIDTRDPEIHQLAMTLSKQQVSEQELNARINAIYRKVAQLLAATLIGELIPPDVVAREGDNILLESRAGTLRRGDRLAVLGPDIVEPDSATGLMVRQDGMRIAMLEVTYAEDNRIVAKVTQGNAFGVQPGCLVRRVGLSASPPATAAASDAAR